SVEILSPIFSKTGISTESGKSSIVGMEAILGPFSNFTSFASSYGKGLSNKLASIVGCLGSSSFGYFMFNVLGSVIFPVNAEAAAVSGLHKKTLSSFVPELPGKFLGVVLGLFLPDAVACPIPIHPLHPAWCMR